MSGRHLWQEAAAFAARAHRDQIRRDGRTPYFSHTARVAMTAAVVFGAADETILAAALLHDVIEDTTVDYDDLLKRFGREVADIVSCLSKDTRVEEEQREEQYHQRLAAGPWQARLIKLADVYDNLIDAADEKSSRTMLQRARAAVALAGDDPKLAGAAAIVQRLIDEEQPAG